jgi:membrane associated rhomboid family serine protease
MDADVFHSISGQQRDTALHCSPHCVCVLCLTATVATTAHTTVTAIKLLLPLVLYCCCAGGSAAAWLLLPRRAPIQGCGSTGALFALFSMATLFNRRKTWHWQRLFELAVLLPFVCQQLLAGHAGMNQWCLLYGQCMGAWVPLLGGLAGAAAAAAVLALVRLLVSRVERQRQQQAAELAGGQQGPAGGDDSMSLLLTKALAQMLRRVL